MQEKRVPVLAMAPPLALGLGRPARAVDRLVQVPALTVSHVILDFDQMPAGPTSLAAINAAFPDAGLLVLAFTDLDTDDTVYDCKEVNDPGCVGTFPAGGGRRLMGSISRT